MDDHSPFLNLCFLQPLTMVLFWAISFSKLPIYFLNNLLHLNLIASKSKCYHPQPSSAPDIQMCLRHLKLNSQMLSPIFSFGGFVSGNALSRTEIPLIKSQESPLPTPTTRLMNYQFLSHSQTLFQCHQHFSLELLQ